MIPRGYVMGWSSFLSDFLKKIPSGKLTVCYWKWPSRRVDKNPFKMVDLSSSLRKRLPEGTGSVPCVVPFLRITQWIDLRDNLQETMDFPMKYGAFLFNFSLKPIHWITDPFRSSVRSPSPLGGHPEFSGGDASLVLLPQASVRNADLEMVWLWPPMKVLPSGKLT